MSVQLTYNYKTNKGIAGGIYDMYHYPVDSRINEENTGVLTFGMGVVRGTLAGTQIKKPVAASTAALFEGVLVNGFTNQQDLEGQVYILNNQNVGVMRKGRIWVKLATGVTPAYGDALYLVASGDEAGCFTNDGTSETITTVELSGRFIGGADNGIAPVELG